MAVQPRWHASDFTDADAFRRWMRAQLESARPHLSADHPTLVVLTELNGLPLVLRGGGWALRLRTFERVALALFLARLPRTLPILLRERVSPIRACNLPESTRTPPCTCTPAATWPASTACTSAAAAPHAPLPPARPPADPRARHPDQPDCPSRPQRRPDRRDRQGPPHPRRAGGRRGPHPRRPARDARVPHTRREPGRRHQPRRLPARRDRHAGSAGLHRPATTRRERLPWTAKEGLPPTLPTSATRPSRGWKAAGRSPAPAPRSATP